MAVAAVFLVALLAQTTFAHPLTHFKNPGFPVLNVVCPDSTKECPNGNTCCSRGDDNFSCCPRLKAVCCSDHKHCCPEGYTCDEGSEDCLKVSSTHPMIELVQSTVTTADSINNILCPDGKEQCPNGDTCCLVADGSYGCCPKPNAVCCADMKHCCPFDYACDSTTGKCTDLARTHPLIELIQQNNLETKSPDSIVCPNKIDSCPEGDTCCPIDGSREGCCPHPDAECCPDHEHCCPKGYHCGGHTGGACLQGKSSHPLVELVRLPETVICPDKKHECPTGETCCEVAGGSYGCCPKINAVCCADMTHCCPEGTTCGPSTCNGASNHPLIELAAQFKPQSTPPVVTCPNSVDTCSQGSTCCGLDSGRYACCPMEDAVCCEQFGTCCAKGHACNEKDAYCRALQMLDHVPFL